MTSFKWRLKTSNVNLKNANWLTHVLAKNRGLSTPQKLHQFLNPTLDQILGVKPTDLPKATQRIKRAIKSKEKIIVYSDYDADGLCATAIMWETLHDLGADVMPHVPHRVTEGYGMSTATIDNLAHQGVKLIITVDLGVSANRQVAHAQKLGIGVIITDHHVLPQTPPTAIALVHTTELCGAGVSWRLCWEIVKAAKPQYRAKLIHKLELAAFATIADMVPLIGGNRAIVKLGLEQINQTQRPGIKALTKSAGITSQIGTYEIGHILAPRINAMGRIEHGLESLRLLCAKSNLQAQQLANLLAQTNTRRQDLTSQAITHATSLVEPDAPIGVVVHHSWHEGVIGLVASRLVESFWRPMIVISRGQVYSKGSARSIPGFNIVEAIRTTSEFLVDGGGHPMAAGFTIRTEYIEIFKQKITQYAHKRISEELLTPTLEIECVLPKEEIRRENLEIIQKLAPFGVGNREPLFLTRAMLIEDIRAVGPQNQHLKLQIDGIAAIGFNMGQMRAQLRPGDAVDLVYTIAEDRYNGANSLQLKIKDLETHQ